MRIDGTPDAVLGELARRHGGVFTRADALAAGLSTVEVRRRVRTGMWLAESRGVLRAATTPDTIDARERAALARAGTDAVLSHFSAARRWRLGVPDPAQTWLTVPYPRHPRLPSSVRLTRSRHVPDSAVRRVDGLPLLEPARTIVDLARFLDERQLTALALQAMQRELCTHDEIGAWLVRLAGRAGIAMLRAVMREADPGFESILAAEFGHLTTNAGVVLVPRFRVAVPGGDVLCDFADPAGRIDFEVDGFAYHSTPRQVANDRARDRRLSRVGWLTVRYGTNDIRRRPTDTLADVVRQIAQRRGAA